MKNLPHRGPKRYRERAFWGYYTRTGERKHRKGQGGLVIGGRGKGLEDKCREEKHGL